MAENTSNQGQLSLESTDYDISRAGKPDRRMEAGKKDALLFHILGVVSTVLATVWMYTFGTVDPAEMKYFLGMPLWISGAILIYLAMFAIGMVYIYKWEEFPLTAREKEKA